MTTIPMGGGSSPFESWEGCGVGSYVVHETCIERQMPDLSAYFNHPDKPKDFDVDQMLRSMGCDPATGMIRQTLTNTMRLVERAEESLVMEVEVTSNLPQGMEPQKHRYTVPAKPLLEEGKRTVMVDTPDAHAEVLSLPHDAMTPTTTGMREETLTIGGHSIPCHVTESSLDIGGRRMKFKVWVSPEIPGHIARHDMTSDDQHQSMVVTSFEKKP